MIIRIFWPSFCMNLLYKCFLYVEKTGHEIALLKQIRLAATKMRCYQKCTNILH